MRIRVVNVVSITVKGEKTEDPVISHTWGNVDYKEAGRDQDMKTRVGQINLRMLRAI